MEDLGSPELETYGSARPAIPVGFQPGKAELRHLRPRVPEPGVRPSMFHVKRLAQLGDCCFATPAPPVRAFPSIGAPATNTSSLIHSVIHSNIHRFLHRRCGVRAAPAARWRSAAACPNYPGCHPDLVHPHRPTGEETNARCRIAQLSEYSAARPGVAEAYGKRKGRRRRMASHTCSRRQAASVSDAVRCLGSRCFRSLPITDRRRVQQP